MRHIRTIGTPIVLLALLAFLLWGASWGWENLTAPLPSPSPTPCVTTPAKSATAENTTVRAVENGGFKQGLAGQVAQHLRDNDFEVLYVRNTDERVADTIIRGNKENEAALELLQSHFNDAVIEHDDRVDGTVDVLVGTRYAGINQDFKKEVVTEEGVVCEFVSPEPGSEDSAEVEPEEESTATEG